MKRPLPRLPHFVRHRHQFLSVLEEAGRANTWLLYLVFRSGWRHDRHSYECRMGRPQADHIWTNVIIVIPIHAPNYRQEPIATSIDKTSSLKRRKHQLSSNTFKGGEGFPLTSSIKVSRVMANDIVFSPDSRSLSPLSSATCRKRRLGFPAGGRTSNNDIIV